MAFRFYNVDMREAVVLRYFYNEEKAKRAVEIIKAEGFNGQVVEDKFNKTSFDKFGMRRRFKVMVELQDYNNIAEMLAKRLNRTKMG